MHIPNIFKMRNYIHWDTLRFIMEDLVTKLESVLGIVRNADVQQYAINDVVKNLLNFFPNIMDIFMQVSTQVYRSVILSKEY